MMHCVDYVNILRVVQSCPLVGWIRGSGRVGSGRVTILPDFGGSGRVGSALRIFEFSTDYFLVRTKSNTQIYCNLYTLCSSINKIQFNNFNSIIDAVLSHVHCLVINRTWVPEDPP